MTAHTRSRPIRVVFLVEENEHWQPMIAAIFSNCYSRWGGRFNLIVPCESSAPRPAFLPWIEAYDPDIIYSYVDLAENTIKSLQERITPSFLVRHEFIGENRDKRAFRPKLPLPGLGALSTCLKASDSALFSGRHQIQLIDKHPAWQSFLFLDTNWGTYYECSERWPMSRGLADWIETVTLTPQRILDDPRLFPKPVGDVITSEKGFFEFLTENRQVVGFSMLSAWDVPRIEINERHFGDSFNLVVGDSFNDYLMFWNLRSYYPAWLDRDLAILLVSQKELDQPYVFQSVCNILRWRNRVTTGSNSQATVSIRSMSVSVEELQQVFEKLNNEKIWLWREPERLQEIDEIAPKEEALLHSRGLVRDAMFQPDDWHEIVHTKTKFRPPTVVPNHLRGISPPTGEIRQGMWAQDLNIEREVNLSRYANVRHIWKLPRRLSITNAFVGGYQTWSHSEICLPRVNSDRMLTLYADFDGKLPKVTNPNDVSIFHTAFCNSQNPWPFKRQDREKVPKQIAMDIRLSDKGRYFRALLGRAGTLNEAEGIFLHKFWLECFEQIGATPASTEPRFEIVNKTLKKRFRGGEISSDTEWERLTKLVLQEARKVRLSQHYLRFDNLEQKFETFRNSYWEAHGSVASREEWDEEERLSLQESVQYLVSKRILHQGLEWRCGNCANKNWLSIDSLTQKMVCGVCAHVQPAPVSFSWQFQLDGFILDGLREHGLLPCLWSLVNLNSQAQSSFYFCESIQLYYDETAYGGSSPDAEVDLIVVVDGLVYLCEVKSSAREFCAEKFVEISRRVRPDVALLAVMGDSTPTLVESFQTAKERLAAVDIGAKLMTLQDGEIRDDPHLHTGSSYSVKIAFG